MRSTKWLVITCVSLLGCPAAEPGDDELGSSETEASETETDASSDTDSETSSETETETGTEAETGTETETGEPCTGIECNSTLTLTFEHALNLDEGPHRFYITLPNHDLICSVEAAPEGEKSCFGFAFTDLSWTESVVTVFLTNPFFDAELNPNAEPFESVSYEVELGREVLFAGEMALDGGEAEQPDPCGPMCWQAVGGVVLE